MKKQIQIVFLVIVIALSTAWIVRTIQSSKAPVPPEEAAVVLGTLNFAKSNCTKEADMRVEKKFDDTDFDANTKTYLQTSWHDTYFEACLFKSGFDLQGNRLAKTTIEERNGRSTYTNPTMNISFELNGTAEVIDDNNANPDFDKQLYTSLINAGGEKVLIQVKRNYEQSTGSIADIENDIAVLFGTQSDIVSKLATTSLSGIQILEIQEDDATFGIVFFTREKNLVYISGKLLSHETLSTIADTLSFPKD